LDNNIYYEEHHIIPKSLGGTDNKNNLAILTGREHFICHWLLTKMTDGVYYEKMVFALCNMERKNKHQKRHCTKITSRVYEKYKKVASKVLSKKYTGCTQTKESNLKRSLSLIGRKKGPMGDEHREKISVALSNKPRPTRVGVPTSLKGKTYTEIMGEDKANELIKAKSQLWTGRKVSEQTKIKQSLSRKGRKTGGENSNAKPFTFNNIEYPTIKEAIAASGMSEYKFNKIYRDINK